MADSFEYNDSQDDGIEPIAIIGLSCRFPGEASSPEGLWNMMSNARSGRSKIPADRFNADAWYHPNHDRRGAINIKHGFFLKDDVSLFDAPFFSITAKEASGMDPMQRIMLEVAYEGFENAGISIHDLPGSKTSVYCGCFTGDYDLLSNHDIYDNAPNAATGTGRAMLSNRVSWFFDLRGPSFTIDTACSSSLYALHLACQSLRLGESKQALVSGANLVLHPNMVASLTNMHFLSPDGICHSFDDRANGYARGEALGAIVLKPLKAALADGDTIRAVIRGTGANQDGKTPGITMPSAEAQAELLRTTYADARLPFTDTGYFEAHGTGTGLGDPTELSAIGATFGAVRKPEHPPLLVGSIKTNIGHTEGCSGLAGIIKTVLCLEKGVLPPNAGFENLNPKLQLAEWKIALPLTAMPWPRTGLRRASVNSFGYGGANAHAILDDAYNYLSSRGLKGNHQTLINDDSESDSGVSTGAITPPSDQHTSFSSQNKLFVFSSQDQAGLQRMSATYLKFLDDRSDVSKLDAQESLGTDDLAYTLACRRTHFDYRSFAVAGSTIGLSTGLTKGLPKIKRASKSDNIVLVFTGQGAQWPSMGTQLLGNRIFHDSMLKSQSQLESLGCSWDIFEELEKTHDSRIDSADFSQPICTALQLALVDLIRQWGVQPKATVGHSSGEIGAAYAAGAISHEDAIKIAYLRGVYSADINNRRHGAAGAMMAAGLSEAEAQMYLSRVPEGSAVVACINSPSSVTLSGDDSSITQLESLLQKDGKFARKLRVKTAYHSPHMQAIADDYLRAMGTINILPGTSSTVIYSSVTGKLIKSKELDASYWVRNMVNPVRFADAVQGVLTHSSSTRGRRKTTTKWSAMIEVGPHEALKGPLNQTMTSVDNKLPASISYTALVMRGRDANITSMEAAGHLWSLGHSIDLAKVNCHDEEIVAPKALANLPAYPWNHQKGFWHEPPMTTAKRFRNEPRTDLLGVPLDNQNTLEPRWRNFLRIPENPWLEHHEITGTVLYPGAGILIMALEAANQLADPSRKLKGFEFQNVTFDRGLVIPSADQAVETSLSMLPHKTFKSSYKFTVFSKPPAGTWTDHSSGMISIVYDDQSSEIEVSSESTTQWATQTARFQDIRNRSTKQVNVRQFYKNLAAIGMGYGSLFTNMVEAAAAPGSHCAHGTIEIPDTKSIMPHQFEYPHMIHPATLDAIFHLLFVGFAEGNPLKESAVPVTMEKMFVAANLPQGAGQKYTGYTEAVKIGEREAAGNLIISDENWTEPKILIHNFAAREISSGASGASISSDSLLGSPKRCARVLWKEDIELLKGAAATKFLKEESQLTQISSSTGLDEVHAQLGVWLDRACFKDAELKVIIVGNKISSEIMDLVRRFAPKSGRKLCFRNCSVTESSQELLDKAQQGLAADNLNTTYRVLDCGKSAEEQGFELESYDIVLSDTHTQSGVSYETALASLRSLLCPGGMLALAGLKHNTINEETGWQAVFQDAGLEDLVAYVENEETALVVGAAGAKDQIQTAYTEIVLLERSEHSDTVSNMTEKLSKLLVSQGLRVQTASLSEADTLEGKAVISLLEVDEPLVINWSSEDLENFKRLVSSASYLMWITRGGQMINSTALEFAPSTGMLRTVRTEIPQITLPHLDLSPAIDLEADKTAELVVSVLHLSTRESSKNNEMEYVETDGKVMIPRVIEDQSFDRELELHSEDVRPTLAPLGQGSRPLRLDIGSVGALDTLRWISDKDTAEPLSADDVEIQTTTVSLNSSDVQAVLGQKSVPTIGREAVGVVSRVGSNVSRFQPGQTVVVLTPNACRTHIRQNQSLIHEVPKTMSPQVAASIPTVFTTAYHALKQVAHLCKDESIFIQSAAGGLGQAAIQIAKSVGAEIFVSVGSKAKRELLVKTYGIAEDHIFDSRTKTFSAGILRMTDGKGVDVILSSSSGEALNQTCSCIAEFGRFVDVGKKVDSAELTTALFRRNVTFASIDMEHMAETKSAMAAKLLQETFDFVKAGRIGEIFPTTEFSISNAVEALKWMQTGDHSGKVVLNFDANAVVPMVPSKPPRLEVDPEASYVLAGGLGGLGPKIAETLFEGGARHIIFLSRSGATTEEHEKLLERLEARGCKADAIKCDISNAAAVEKFVETSKQRSWKIKGLVQCAMVLRDSVLDNMTFEKWQGATQPKIAGTWNLHTLLPKDLDFFILLSSVVSVIGNTGQANYAAGNSYLDALAHYRKMHGLAATSINVGLVSDASHFTEDSSVEDFLEKYRHLAAVQVTESELNIVLETAMRGKTADNVPVPTQIIAGMSGDLQREGSVTSLWPKDRKFDHRAELGSDSGADGNKNELKKALTGATTAKDAAKAVEDALKANLAAAMTALAEDIDADKPLHAFGIDSLKAVEVRNWVFREIKSDISVFEILSPISLARLSVKIAGKSKYVSPEVAKQAVEDALEE